MEPVYKNNFFWPFTIYCHFGATGLCGMHLN